MRIMTSRKALLNNLLRALVQAWGQGEVEAALADLSDTATSADARQRSGDEARANHSTRSQMKLRASEQVARA